MSEEKTIVIVEDEQDTAEMFAEMMRVSGYRVCQASGSQAAMRLIDKEQPAAVILDIMMPDISGLEVLHFMQGRPKLARIPVVVVSAKSTQKDIRATLEAGAVDYLAKPVGFQDLRQAVERALKS
ncbi:MAG TPA: response regulator [Anaerolineales bacterium]|nr:response regulator [Anaerolineales bacterium]